MVPGEEIVRLPCLCIYHLKYVRNVCHKDLFWSPYYRCAKKWFKVSQTCPEHPDLA
jgi:hypothetical protein